MTPRVSTIPWARIGVALFQSAALFLLVQASIEKAWPASDGLVFAPLVAIVCFVPPFVISGLSILRARTLVLWACALIIICAGVAIYDIFRDPVDLSSRNLVPRNLPSAAAWLSLCVVLFIAHASIVSGESERRVVANYATYFEIASKHAIQFLLSITFALLFWGLLYLGAELFRLIHVEAFGKLIQRESVRIPTTALVFNYAIHVTDVSPSIVRGARSLALLLVSWLLPLMALLVAAFIAALPFTGLEPLWATKHATSILLLTAGILVLLINAAYQDGRSQFEIAAVVRYASVLAVMALVCLVILAAYAVWLRIGQYGLTPDRIYALASIVAAGCFGLGYFVAVARSGVSLKGLASTNLLTSLVIAALLLMLRSPIADSNRISVNDQISRLNSGRTSLDSFDFIFFALQGRSLRHGCAWPTRCPH